MTLGGLALAVGILVDDATVAIENINCAPRDRARSSSRRFSTAPGRSRSRRSSRRSASASCSCRCSSSPASARYLFVPMAEAVVFAMLASYVLSRTLVPTMAKYLLQAHGEHTHRSVGSNPRAVSARSTRLRAARGYRGLLERCVDRRADLRAPCSSAAASHRCCWSAGSARTSFRRSTAASSSCTCARRPARASRRRRPSATASRPRSAR